MRENSGKHSVENTVSEKSLSRSVTQSDKSMKPAVFLDRDGTIINDIGYLADPEGISFFPGVPEALKRLQDRGYLLVVITNQSVIGRGYFNEETALSVNLHGEVIEGKGCCPCCDLLLPTPSGGQLSLQKT